MILNESLFENYDNEEEWVEVDSKSVRDSDGFYTDYTWYTNGKKHIFIFGDSEIYTPEDSDYDWEVEIYPGNEQNAMDEAQEWFDNYKGFDEDESLNESTVITDADKISSIVNYIYADAELPSDITEDEVEEFNANQLADYIFYREWEGDDSILPEAVEKLETAYNEMMGDDDYDEDEESLNEDFSPSMPTWLTRWLKNNQQYLKRLSNRSNLDLNRLTFVKVPKDEIPTNGFHPLMKDTTKQLVYLLRDEMGKVIIYLPGYNDKEAFHANSLDKDTYSAVGNLPKKSLLDYTLILGYIDLKDESSFNRTKKGARADAIKGVVERGKGQYPWMDKEYETKEDGSRDWDTYKEIQRWAVTKGQDKSGFEIDAEKYKKKLDSADMKTYGIQMERYAKKLNSLRLEIVDFISNMRVDRSIDSWGSGISEVIRYFEDAIFRYERLQKDIDDIINDSDRSDEQKNNHIQRLFDSNGYFGSIKDLRDNIESAQDKLRQVKEKAAKRNSLSETLDSEEDEMAKLAKKHNLDILSPMGGNPGEMRVSGSVKDLDAFYREAEELGILGECLHPVKVEEALTMHNFDEFKTIADEVGLTTAGDLERFRKEEVQPGEDELTAIKRYKQELIDAGVDLSKLINEGAFKDIAIDLDAGEDFISILKRDLVPAKKELYRLQDKGASEDAIEKAQEKVDEIEAKLKVIKNSGK